MVFPQELQAALPRGVRMHDVPGRRVFSDRRALLTSVRFWRHGNLSRGNELARIEVDDGIGFDEEIGPKNAIDPISVVELTQFDIEVLCAEISDAEKFDPLCEYVFEATHATDTMHLVIGQGRYIDRRKHFRPKQASTRSRVEKNVFHCHPAVVMRQFHG